MIQKKFSAQQKMMESHIRKKNYHLLPTSVQEPGDEIDVYIESGQSVYNAQGGNLANTIVFITGIFTQSYVLYANDGISVRTSSMMVWVTPDPFSGGDSLSTTTILSLQM